MKKIFFLSIVSLLLICSLQAQTGKLLIAGSGNKQIVLMNKSTKKIEWSQPILDGEECNSVALLKNGSVLYSYKKGAKLVNVQHQVLWDYKVDETCELQSASPLPNGGFLLGICGNPARIVELNKTGKVQKEITFNTEIAQAHGQFRQIIRSKSGNYIVPLMSRAEIAVIDTKGTILRTYKVEGNPFSVVELKNKNLLVACGDAHAYVEVNTKTGQIVRRIGSKEVAEVDLCFVAQVSPLSNGNVLLCNWTGHEKMKTSKQYPLVELNSKNQVVWSLSEQEVPGMVSALHVTSIK